MSYNFCLFFNFFIPKKIFFENFKFGMILMDFVGFPFRTSKLKNDKSTTLNTSFHIDLGRVIGD
jgi:hypothetical protein